MHSAQNNAKRSEGEENISNDMDDNVDSGVCVGGGGSKERGTRGNHTFITGVPIQNCEGEVFS